RAVRQRQPEQHQRGIRRPGKGRETRDHRALPRTGNQPELTVTVQRPPERRSAIRPRLPRPPPPQPTSNWATSPKHRRPPSRWPPVRTVPVVNAITPLLSQPSSGGGSRSTSVPTPPCR